MKKARFRVLSFAGFVAVLSALIAVVSCTSNSSNDSSSTTLSYQGPGSVWTMSKTGSTYTLRYVEGSNSMDITASSTSLTTGHTKLTVTAASGTGMTAPTVGTNAMAVEIPGTAFLLQPMEANAETIAMLSSGSCPASNFTANWVIGKRPSSASSRVSDDSKDWFGSIDWTVATGAVNFPVYRSLEAPTVDLGGGSSTLGTCSSGKVTWNESGCGGTNPNSAAYFTSSGLIVVATCQGTADQSHIIGIPQAAASTGDIAGDYAGFLYNELNDDTSVVTATVSGSVLTTSIRTGASLDTVSSSFAVTFSGANSPANGMFVGTAGACAGGSEEEQDGTCEFVCTSALNVNSSGRTMLYCIGQDPADEDRRMTLLLVEKS